MFIGRLSSDVPIKSQIFSKTFYKTPTNWHLYTYIFYLAFGFYVIRANIFLCVVSLVLTNWLYDDISQSPSFCTIFYHLFVNLIYLSVHIVHRLLYILHAIYHIAIYSRTLTHLAAVICWLYPTLNTFHLILFVCFKTQIAHSRGIVEAVLYCQTILAMCFQT